MIRECRVCGGAGAVPVYRQGDGAELVLLRQVKCGDCSLPPRPPPGPGRPRRNVMQGVQP